MVLITIAVASITAIVSGLATYFAVRPSTAGGNSGATAEIRNDVNIEENDNRGSEVLVIVIATVLVIIALIKVAELIIFSVNRCRRSMKKRYERQLTRTPHPTAPKTSDSNV